MQTESKIIARRGVDLERNQELEIEFNKKRHEAEVIREELRKAQEAEEALHKNPPLSLEAVTEQMANGMVTFEDAPIRFRVVQFFEKRLSMPIPIDYLNAYTKEKDIAVLINDNIGISLSLQFTISEKKNVTFQEVRKGLIGQLKAAGIYIELLEEGEVEDEIAPTYFITYRMPTSRGVMYHMVFYSIHKKDGAMIIGNYNCFYKDIDKWENIIKATISYLDFH